MDTSARDTVKACVHLSAPLSIPDKLVTYHVVRDFHDRSGNPNDIVEPFILEALKATPQSKDALRKAIQRAHSFEIPNAVITNILQKLVRQNVVVEKSEKYALRTEGPAAQLQDQVRDIRRRLEALYDDASGFFASRGIKLERETFLQLFDELLVENTAHVLAAVSPGAASLDIQDLTSEKRALLAYIADAEARRPVSYETISRFLSGAILSIFLRAKRQREEILGEAKTKLIFYLDANFVLSLLGLDSEEAAAGARQTRDAIASNGHECRVLDISLSEVSHLLLNYPKQAHLYTAAVPTRHLYWHLKTRGWTSADVTEYVADLHTKIAGEGIAIETSNVNLTSYKPTDATEAGAIEKYRTYKSNKVRRHDLAAIDYVRAKRGGKARKFSEARVFFVTSDRGLARYNQEAAGHTDDGTVVEAILDIALCNILWLQNPSLKVPVLTLVALHAHTGVVSDRLWKSFHQQLLKLRSEGALKDDSIAALLYHDFLREALARHEEEGGSEVTAEDVLRMAALAATTQEAEAKKLETLARESKEAAELAAANLKELGRARAQELLQANLAAEAAAAETKRLAERLDTLARRSAGRQVLGLKLVVAAALTGFGIWGFIALGGEVAGAVIGVGSLVLAAVNFRLDGAWAGVHHRLLARRRRVLGLEEAEGEEDGARDLPEALPN